MTKYLTINDNIYHDHFKYIFDINKYLHIFCEARCD